MNKDQTQAMALKLAYDRASKAMLFSDTMLQMRKYYFFIMKMVRDEEQAAQNAKPMPIGMGDDSGYKTA